MKRKKWVALAIAMTMVIPQGIPLTEASAAETGKNAAVTQEAKIQKQMQKYNGPLALMEDVPDADMSGFESVVGDAYTLKSVPALLADGKFGCSDTGNITMKEDERANGILIKGSTVEALNQAVFTIGEEFDFGEDGYPSRLMVNGLSDRKKDVKLKFFVDGADEPFTEVQLNRRVQSKVWTTEGEISQSIAAAKLKGKHTITMKVETAKADIFMLRSIEFVKNDQCPALYFDLEKTYSTVNDLNSSEDHSVECYGKVTLETPEGYTGEYTGETTKELTRETLELDYIRGRGNSTWMTDKKPYKVKLDKKKDFFGMGASKHWTLIANRYDNSKLRNRITYWMGEQMGFAFTPRMVPVDVIVNGIYYGSYMLCEQVRVGKSRVDIDDLDDTPEVTDEPEVTGGYLLGMSPYEEDAEDAEIRHTFRTTHDNSYELESPSFEDSFNESQYEYIRNYVQGAEDAVFGEDFKDENGKSWREFVDEDAAIRYYWMQEFSKNGDAYGSPSTYLYKPREGKLFWGPLWDFDYVAWGDLEYGENLWVEGFGQAGGSVMFSRLIEEKAFTDNLVTYYRSGSGKDRAFSDLIEEASKDGGQLDIYEKQMEIADYYDKEKWGAYSEGGSGYGGYGNGYGEEAEQNPVVFRSYKEEVETLKSWMQKRKAWVDENIELIVPKKGTITFKADGKTLGTQEIYLNRFVESLNFPELPTRKGYVFDGWYRGDGTKVGEGDSFEADTVLEARWISEEDYIWPQKIQMPCNKATFYFEDGSMGLNYELMPMGVNDVVLSYESDNPDVAIASTEIPGSIDFTGVGTANITMTTPNGVKNVFEITVLEGNSETSPDIEYGKFSLSKKSLNMKPYEEQAITVEWDGVAPAYDGYSFISTDPEVADVDPYGVVSAFSNGSCYIIVSDEWGNKGICQVTVGENARPDNGQKNNENSENKTNSNGSAAANTANTVNTDKSQTTGAKTYKKGSRVLDNDVYYTITKMAGSDKNGKVTVSGAKKKNVKKVVIPDSITIDGKNYTVTGIAGKAFYKKKKLKTIDLSGALHLKKIGSKAFGRIHKKASFIIPSNKVSTYKKLLKKTAGYDKKKMKLYVSKNVPI